MTTETALEAHTLEPCDLADLVALDAAITGEAKDAYWADVFARFPHDESCVMLGVKREGRLEGYLFGEVRAIEFGSDACGWILALGVHTDTTRQGHASALLNEARLRFQRRGVLSIRTMVTRTDVPFLALFRRQGFVGGPFVQLQLDIATNDNHGSSDPGTDSLTGPQAEVRA